MNLSDFQMADQQETVRTRSLIRRFLAWGLGLILLLVGALSHPALSWAGEPPSTEPSPPLPLESPTPNHSGLSASDISSEKVSQFVKAYLQVVTLIERREGELQGAETETESLQVQQEIENDAFQAIADAGLTWQEYLQLLGLANTDPEFGERVAIQLQESPNK